MISVLVVEDEEITAEANRLFVERVPGFRRKGWPGPAGRRCASCGGARST